MAKTATTKRTHRDHTITLNDNMTFDITGPMFVERDRGYPETVASLHEAIEKIDKWADRREKQKKAEATVNLPVLTDEAKLVHIKGIHSTRGTYLYAEGDVGSSDVHPNLPWIEALLKERSGLSARVTEINKTLEPFEMRTHVYGWTRGGGSDYEEGVRRLVEEHATLLREATKAGAKVK